MSDDFDGDSGDNDIPDDEYGEGGIPPDMEADIEERVRREVDERAGDLYEDSRPRSGGCLLILALPALALWFLR
jgi:hypothetical protein